MVRPSGSVTATSVATIVIGIGGIYARRAGTTRIGYVILIANLVVIKQVVELATLLDVVPEIFIVVVRCNDAGGTGSDLNGVRIARGMRRTRSRAIGGIVRVVGNAIERFCYVGSPIIFIVRIN